jgi:ankyrin repeat protein
MAHNADPALKDSQGRTASDIAKQKGNNEAVGLLTRR